VTTDLLDALAHNDASSRAFETEMKGYKGKLILTGGLGFGLESDHERKVFRMLYKTSAWATNTVLVATNILAKSNALLNIHGIYAQLVMEKKSHMLARDQES